MAPESPSERRAVPARGAPPAGRPSRSVRRLLGVVLSTSAVVVLTVGLTGSLAVRATTETVDTLSQELGPAQVSNAEFMEAMLDAETELRAYLISGERSQLGDHRAALERAPQALAELLSYAETDPSMAELAQRQERLAASWLEDFARPAIRAGPTVVETDRPLFELGVRRFDALKSVNRLISSRLTSQVTAARQQAQDRLDMTVALIALFGVCGAAVCGLLGWRVMRSIRRPLRELEDVVEHLAAGEHDVRAPLTGPTEIRRLGRAINEMAEENARARAMELEFQQSVLEIDRVKSEFVSNVSHELRTPLTSISGYLELLAEDLEDDLDPSHLEMMEVMRRNAARLSALIEDLLDLGRLEREPERLQAVDVARVIEDVARDLRLSAGTRSVTIDVDVDGSAGSARVLADGAQLHRALTNLVSNAVKFSHDGGAVRLELGRRGPQVEVTVSDDGIGIPGPDQDKLGERFYRASNAVAAHIPGTGLGLRMVQMIVGNHQGSFALHSREGQGTTATVRLPSWEPSPLPGPRVPHEEQNPVPER